MGELFYGLKLGMTVDAVRSHLAGWTERLVLSTMCEDIHYIVYDFEPMQGTNASTIRATFGDGVLDIWSLPNPVK